jgi:hypothetical protein
VIDPAGTTLELRPFPGVAGIAYVVLRNLGICALAAYPLFDAGTSRSEGFLIAASGVIALACLVILARDLVRCCPIVLEPTGFIRAGWRSVHISECQRIVIRHVADGRYRTILQTRNGDIWFSNHGDTRNDVDDARRLAQTLQIGAYTESGGKPRKLPVWR